jgi:hypothetical protein
MHNQTNTPKGFRKSKNPNEALHDKIPRIAFKQQMDTTITTILKSAQVVVEAAKPTSERTIEATVAVRDRTLPSITDCERNDPKHTPLQNENELKQKPWIDRKL